MRRYTFSLQKRKGGAISRPEKRKQHERAQQIAENCHNKCKKIVHIVKDQHTMVEKRIIQIVK